MEVSKKSLKKKTVNRKKKTVNRKKKTVNIRKRSHDGLNFKKIILNGLRAQSRLNYLPQQPQPPTSFPSITGLL